MLLAIYFIFIWKKKQKNFWIVHNKKSYVQFLHLILHYFVLVVAWDLNKILKFVIGGNCL